MVRQDYKQLLKPEIINSISGLSLLAKVIVDGYLSGFNKSLRVGAGQEFSQYRGYEPGDDLRLLDWKMLARSGRYYIKQSEIDTHVAVKFIIDASKSMQHSEKGLSKINFAKVLVASIAHLAQKQGDAVGLYALNNKGLKSMQPTVNKKQFHRFLHELISIHAEGKWPANTIVLDQVHDRSKKELVFFISDMYEHNLELTTLIKDLKTKRNELVVLQLLGLNELEFGYDGFVVFEDLETGDEVKVQAEEAKALYLKAFNKKMKQTKNTLLSLDVTHQIFQLNEPIANALQLFLKERRTLL